MHKETIATLTGIAKKLAAIPDINSFEREAVARISRLAGCLDQAMQHRTQEAEAQKNISAQISKAAGSAQSGAQKAEEQMSEDGFEKLVKPLVDAENAATHPPDTATPAS